ncbi:AAA family ATPase [Abyssisolibacter fermentans]|uniref:AAA family ATPase n=1 Tax=Abyssisolibacter fermentans TaxID=1766203 RepID=UPI00082BE68E|nr:AAA family ATPase [Abyssisolibacter fermentans]
MSRGIIIFGSSGSGKTTLGKMVAERLGFPYYDLDDYIWRRDTVKPFTVMYTREEKINRLMSDISQSEFFVMAGSMDSFNTPFVPLFDLAVHITASVEVRLARINKREYKRFGKRILEGGDLYENHQRFLNLAARYDSDGSPSMKTHKQWANLLPCKVIRINGEDSLSNSMELIVNVYRELIYQFTQPNSYSIY